MWPQLITQQSSVLFEHQNKEGFIQPERNFGMFVSPRLVIPDKRFSGFKKPSPSKSDNNCQIPTIIVDKSPDTNNTNSCCHHKSIIDSIKELNPKLIPCITTTTIEDNMCLETPTVVHAQARKSKKKPNNKILKELIMEDLDITEQQQQPTTDTLSASDPPNMPTLYDFILSKKAQLPNRSHTISVTDSEDSFIIFDNDGNEEGTTTSESEYEKSPGGPRTRLPSICESEDSFITFEGDDADEDSEDDMSESQLEEDSEDEDSDGDDSGDGECDEVDSPYSIINHKKVRFAAPEKLCEVHPMIKWSYAYQAARKGPWEMYARDRSRFRDRALRMERDLKKVFDPEHRAKIYRERFEKID